MIKTKKQYKIKQSQAAKITSSIKKLKERFASNQSSIYSISTQPSRLEKAVLDCLISQYEDLREQCYNKSMELIQDRKARCAECRKAVVFWVEVGSDKRYSMILCKDCVAKAYDLIINQ